MRPQSIPFLLASAVTLVTLLLTGSIEAHAQTAPSTGSRQLDPDCIARPIAQFTTWIGAAGGTAFDARHTHPTFDLRMGGGVTGPLNHRGVVRLGPSLELRASPHLGYVMGFAELELSIGELPRDFLHHSSMEGVFAVRGGVGWSNRALATVTITYGTRTTGETIEGYNLYRHCRGPAEEVIRGKPVGRGIARCDYAWGIRAFVSATADREQYSQVVVGLEVYPFSILLHPTREFL